MKKFFSNKTNILLSILLIAILTGIIFLIASFFEKPKIYAIDYSKLTEQEITAWAEKEGITGENLQISYQYDETVEKGRPVSQKPKEGEEIKDILSIVISQGPDPTRAVELPPLDSMTKETIASWFQKNHFTDVTYEYVLDPTHPKDTVLALNATGSVKRETPILVTLSAGEEAENVKITVPDFSTYSKANITAWGESNQVNVKFVNVFSDTVAEGSVIDQGTRAGAEVTPGSTITVTISSGKAVELADLYNMTASEAKAWADKNNITLNFINYYSSEVAEGKIISTSPKAHTLISSGSTVRVYISIGKDPADDMVKVDDQHVGVSESAFLDYISSLGLKVQKQSYAYYSSQIDKDHIFYYDDGEFKKGSTISYALSAGPFELDLTKIEGKTRSEVNSYMYEINNLNGHLAITFTEEESTNRVDGTVYDCKTTTGAPFYEVACKVAVNENGSSTGETYWIDFDPNGGSGTMNRVTVPAGSKYKLPDCTFTAPAGKTFDKWDEGKAGDTVTVNSNRRMIAQWKDKTAGQTFWIDFDPNGGSGNMARVTVEAGSNYKLPECTFTPPAGKEFDKWDEGKAGDTVAVYSNRRMIAQWKDKSSTQTYWVAFDPNGGSGTMATVTVTAGSSYKLPECTFTPPAGKEFDKWDEGRAGESVTVNSNRRMIAQWKDKGSTQTYWIDFDPNGGSGNMARVTVTAGSSYKLPNCTFTPPAGKEFDKWDEGRAGETITINRNSRMIAQWKDKSTTQTYWIDFDPNGGSGTMARVTVTAGSSYKLPNCTFTPPAGKEFDKWDEGRAGETITINRNSRMIAQWKDKSSTPTPTPTTTPATTYWIDFDPNGGSGTMSRVTVTAGSNYKLPNCTFTAPAGKEFEKWDEGYAGDTVTINSNRRMIAQWKNKGGSSTSYLPPLEILDGVGGNSYQEKKTNLQNSSFLSPFTNVSYVSTTSRDYSAGTIISVSVYGSTSYDAGDYPVDVPIVITISSGYAN